MEIKININGEDIPQEVIENYLSQPMSNEDFEKMLSFIMGMIPSPNSFCCGQLGLEDKSQKEFNQFIKKFGFHNFFPNPLQTQHQEFLKKSQLCNNIISNGLKRQRECLKRRNFFWPY